MARLYYIAIVVVLCITLAGCMNPRSPLIITLFWHRDELSLDRSSKWCHTLTAKCISSSVEAIVQSCHANLFSSNLLSPLSRYAQNTAMCSSAPHGTSLLPLSQLSDRMIHSLHCRESSTAMMYPEYCHMPTAPVVSPHVR